MSGVFGDSYARLYDSLNSGKDYTEEAAFVVEVSVGASRATRGSLLDIGCGTGRHLEQLRRSFFEVVGADRSPDMLAIAKNRLPDVHFETGDASAIRLGRTFDVVTALFDVLSYQTSNADVVRFLMTIREHLAPDGVAVVDFWHLAGLIAQPPATRVKAGTAEGAQYLRVSVPSVDWATATTAVTMTTLLWQGERLGAEVTEHHRMRAFLVSEVETLATLAGLRVHGSGGWLLHAPATADDWHAYVTLKHID